MHICTVPTLAYLSILKILSKSNNIDIALLQNDCCFALLCMVRRNQKLLITGSLVSLLVAYKMLKPIRVTSAADQPRRFNNGGRGITEVETSNEFKAKQLKN